MDLVTSRVGGEVVSCNDEFFAPATNLLDPHPPRSNDEYTDRGKWMDGWETRRRRQEGHDWCILRLGVPGVVRSVTVDTSHFTGNYPQSFSLDACGVAPHHLDEEEWVEIIAPTALSGDDVAFFSVDDDHRVTFLRLNIYPDGGIARLRVEGNPLPARQDLCRQGTPVDLVSALVGGRFLETSDSHYGGPEALVAPTEPAGMWDGWETARRRGPGHDWATFALGVAGLVESFDVDTRHFKGNAPGWVSLELSDGDGVWREACSRLSIEPDSVNHIDLSRPGPAALVRFNIYPDGGVARLRIWGRPGREEVEALRMRYLDALFPGPARSFFTTACGSSSWVETMVAGRPYRQVEVLMQASDGAFDRLDPPDWREAFAAHPRIGERQGRQTPVGEAMSASEQAGVSGADAEALSELSRFNRDYEERFGFTYIVRASGRSAVEMLVLARQRLVNDYDTELKVATDEQRQITKIRLARMLCQEEQSR